VAADELVGREAESRIPTGFLPYPTHRWNGSPIYPSAAGSRQALKGRSAQGLYRIKSN